MPKSVRTRSGGNETPSNNNSNNHNTSCNAGRRWKLSTLLFVAAIAISELFGLRMYTSSSINVYQQKLTWSLPSQQTPSSPTSGSNNHNHKRYFELQNETLALGDALYEGGTLHKSKSSYVKATVIHKAPWLPSRKMCKETCCVEAVAYSLDQDKEQLIHDRDGADLADIFVTKYELRRYRHPLHAAYFHEALLPCIVPGTIINMHNGGDTTHYWFSKIRSKIHVPYVLSTTGSDINSPQNGPVRIHDPLLLKWYGTNPSQQAWDATPEKFQPLELGLSGYIHAQERYVLPYLKLNNFSNPFLDKSRWDLTKDPLDFDKDVFVHFGLRSNTMRKPLYESLCGTNPSSNTTSCGSETTHTPPDQIYADMSRYRFGVSPPGAGWDCYRTYEMLYLGVIPIVHARDATSRELLEGLPVVLMTMTESTTREDIIEAFQNYTASDAFQKESFEVGWKRLFFDYRRRQVLKDSGRDKEILVDENGREYYQSYKYTALIPEDDKYHFCDESEERCSVKEDEIDTSYLQGQQQPMSDEDQSWLKKWEEMDKLIPRDG